MVNINGLCQRTNLSMKNVAIHLYLEKLTSNDQTDKTSRFKFYAYLVARGFLHQHIYDHYFQKIFCETTWPIKTKFYVKLPWEV